MMSAQEFLAEFDEYSFPCRLGPEFDLDSHDPPFRKSDLRKMSRAGLIVLNESTWTYRLTLAAADQRDPPFDPPDGWSISE